MNSPLNDELPVLTQVLVQGHVGGAAARVGLPPRRHHDSSVTAGPQTGYANAASPSDWDPLALRVRDAVLQDLHRHIDEMLEQRLAKTIDRILEPLVRGMAAEMHIALGEALHDIVTRSVNREIEREIERSPNTPKL